jgi:hypothetical protein
MNSLTEKTVELNVIAELLSVIWGRTHRAAIATGPSLKEKGSLPYDIRIDLEGRPFFVQFKRAHRKGHELHYEINFNQEVDQHDRLLNLERFGFAVVYCLPIFDTVATLNSNRSKLLNPQATMWIRPSNLTFSPSHFGHHHLIFDTRSRLLKRNKTAFPKKNSPLSFDMFWDEMLAKGEFGQDKFTQTDYERVHSALNNFKRKKGVDVAPAPAESLNAATANSRNRRKRLWDNDDPPFGTGLTAISLV